MNIKIARLDGKSNKKLRGLQRIYIIGLVYPNLPNHFGFVVFNRDIWEPNRKTILSF